MKKERDRQEIRKRRNWNTNRKFSKKWKKPDRDNSWKKKRGWPSKPSRREMSS